jgi:S-formylglutathione hydrolase FrmB
VAKQATVKRILVAVALFVGVLATPVARADVCAPPRCIDVHVPVPAGLIVPDNAVRILLPAGYDSTTARYPVLYLLHGAGDTYQTWSQNTDVIAFTAALPVIVVMPDGGKSPDSGWYSDWVDGSRDWESFHIGVLIPYVDANYRTLGDGHRAVAGLSMGGFGSLSYAGRHPGLFAAAASFSGAIDTRYLTPLSGIAFTLLHDQFGTPNDKVWGNQVTDSAVWKAHNPTDLVKRYKKAGTKLYLASGTGTPGGPAGDDPGNPGGYLIEQFVFQMNVSFVRALLLQHVPFHQDYYLGGYHGWPYWQRELHWALPQMLNVID